MLHDRFTSRACQDGGWGGSGKEAGEKNLLLPPGPHPRAVSTPAPPVSPVMAPTEQHTLATKGNPMFFHYKDDNFFYFPSCLPQISASPSSRGTGEKNWLSPKSFTRERLVLGCPLLAEAAADIPEDSLPPRQPGGPCFGALCPMILPKLPRQLWGRGNPVGCAPSLCFFSPKLRRQPQRLSPCSKVIY